MRYANLKRIGAGVAAAGLVLLVGATSASASDGGGTQRCAEYGWNYKTYSRTDNWRIPTGVHWKHGPGGTVSASRESTQTATISVSMGVSVSYSAIVAEAEATFGIDASASSSRSETIGYSRKISSNTRYGHVQFGNWGYRMGVKKYYVNSACAVTSSYTGTVTKMPSANVWGYYYWETAA
ncbi:hypothetical protein SAMN04489867_2178 [Pedococcus dokdonensis]|uniref:Uncharacterized protein n=1 Tax=Pedococcus dokdonensis TaxID=443156 RepID=A0A1H0S273_9MICO|nr:hypothetical protein [Pedococcus dokdonensis]SDP35717.1 hypothetical protein SAMN04489867_2178 [Pedococcus dokdonensis]